ncbi:MAG: hypothetical protein HYS05_09530 [Acidobacteria bacterium]|nr:hypothetical protein [Acidobacteriota bacterium]
MEGIRVSQPEFERLQERIVRLERQSRRAKLFAAVVGLMAGATFWMAQVPLPQAPVPPPPSPSASSVQPRSLEATELRLVDAAGRDRIVLLSGKDLPMILFLDSRGRTQMRIGLTARGPSIGYYDERGRFVDLLQIGIRPLTQ